LKKGETLGLVGESGCGKSTVVRALARLYTPTSGKVYLNGKDLSVMRKRELLEARRNMQIVFQNPYASLNPRMTTGDIIAEPMRIYKREKLLDMSDAEIGKRVEDLMDMVGLLKYYKNRYPHEFSGGQRQRIGIARSLALNPQLVLADEPVSALDVSIQAQILNLFKDIQKEIGLSYLFIAHDLAVIEYISDRVAVMYLGKIVEISDYTDLYRNPRHPYTQALLSSAPIPDPKIEAERKRIILTGDVPSPNVRRPGCYFYDRCPQRMDKCKVSQPELKPEPTGNVNHLTACFLCE
jgi:oligopeptide transport system ATP-binding protein